MIPLRQLLLTLTLSLLIVSCTPPPAKKPSVTIPTTDLQPDIAGMPAASTAEQFMLQSLKETGDRRYQLQLKAAGMYIDQEELDQAQEILRSIPAISASAASRRLIKIHSANIAMALHQPRDALNLLIFSDILPPAELLVVSEIRASAFLAAGYPLDAIKTRVQMDNLITDQTRRDNNHQMIWENLSLLPATTLNQLSESPLNPQLMGWIELAKIAKRSQVDWQYLQQGLIDWRKRYADHPAAKLFIQELGNRQIELIDRPNHIAVLLPLSGRYSAIAAAIRDGIMAAYYRHPDSSYRPEINFIDTGENTNIWTHYQTAQSKGANFIIGPFLKTEVTLLSQSSKLNVPTLSLNYADSATTATPNFVRRI